LRMMVRTEDGKHRRLPDLTLVRECVRGGADILDSSSTCANSTTAAHSVLHSVILSGDTEVLKVLLETPREVDFTATDPSGQSPLHCLLASCHSSAAGGPSAERLEAMTSAILQRLEVHPKDHVNWGMKNADGHDFLSLAAKEGVLSYLLPLVKHQDYYRTAPRPFVLTAKPTSAEDWEADWGRFSESGQALFRLAWE